MKRSVSSVIFILGLFEISQSPRSKKCIKAFVGHIGLTEFLLVRGWDLDRKLLIPKLDELLISLEQTLIVISELL